MKTKYYQVRYIDMMGKDKTANISANSEADAVKKFKAQPIFWAAIIYPIAVT